MKENIFITNKTKGKLPSLPLVLIKNDILGKTYDLSIVFVGKKRSANLNEKYRNKKGPTNILSFPYSKKDGEIIICPQVAKTQNKKFNKTYRQFIGFLLIHGMLHLKGMDHGNKMEKKEEFYFHKYFKSTKS